MEKQVKLTDVIEGLKIASGFDDEFASDLISFAEGAKTCLEIQSIINIVKNERDKTVKNVAFDTIRFILNHVLMVIVRRQPQPFATHEAGSDREFFRYPR